MQTVILQRVTIVDMNNEILTETWFEHGTVPSTSLAIGWSVATYPVGLREFSVVYDKRENRTVRYKVVDIEIDLTQEARVFRAYLEPQTLIIGQHDIGMTA
ncbi:hypothetical protein ACFQWB_00375 [Paenibacillus thermoaerophilus]|uniref:Uncharacterized protein n=1 Tax=Paenibacillus thermoaerophilus TaxID=1215385 RepID=A0ABW2UWX0_9BACL|nr:hypothetical protein [Paenibacillus thermoaerophilus]TMV15854.1 hypothetical protein FE781_09685 [Paenibacillus thermoaerophilus]